jgi:lipopolysaccharide/colanic/teichoic acid biosynthesis glycosyltransferase
MRVGARPIIDHGYKTVVNEDDPRVTAIGKFLRVGIDELPQLINIARGEMNWVGPRPDDDWALPLYGTTLRQRLSVPPGITGLSQVLASRHLPIDIVWLDAWIVLSTPLFIMGAHSIGRRRLNAIRRNEDFCQALRACQEELRQAAMKHLNPVEG